MKKAAKEAKATKLPKGTSNRCAARREHVSQSFTRFATQPVTVGEVQEAVRCAISRDVSTTVTGTLSKLLVAYECLLWPNWRVLHFIWRLCHKVQIPIHSSRTLT
jgi:hypothetical protein